MLFNSPVYIFLFLPIAALVYFSLNRRKLIVAGKLWLVLASLFFYGYWSITYLLLIIGSVIVNFGIGSFLHGKQKPLRISNKISRKQLLVTGIFLNIGFLGYFKYYDFFIGNINILIGTDLTVLNLALPLAISFFTFQQIAYLVDSYRSETHEYNFLNYSLFVTFFPQLIAGPIVHHKEMMPQFFSHRNTFIHWENISKGMFIFSIGLFKKVVIADYFAQWANIGFSTGRALSLFDSWVTSLSYTFQLYYDFSGYTDMAIGAALLFNIRLPFNFNSPYKATSIQDFWHRWHMTLSRWLRDYLYIPLGGNRSGRVRTYLNLFITFLIGGLWHGAGWTFIIWGAMHGTALIIHRIWNEAGLRMHALLGWLATFIFINFTWVFFRADSIDSALRIAKGMIGLSENTPTRFFIRKFEKILPSLNWYEGLGVVNAWVAYISLALALTAALTFFGRNTNQLSKTRVRYSLLNALFIAFTLFYAYIITIRSHPPVFLYFNF